MFNHEELEVYFKQKYMPFSEANISVANSGFLYGLGVFTGMRAFSNSQNGKLYIFRPGDHYQRLCQSCKLLRYDKFKERYSEKSFIEIIKQLLIRNSIKSDAYIRVTNFSMENKITPKLVGYGEELSIYLYPLGDYVPLSGMRCKISSWTRVRDTAIPARAKINGSYVNTAFAKAEAIMEGYDEAIFLNDRGHAVEGSAENLFIVRDGVLITPPKSDEILEGITRKSVLELAQDLGIPCIERSISRSELIFADEVFLTGTGAKVSPVVEIDKYKIGNGVVGPISRTLQQQYFSAARGEVDKYKKWVEEV